MSGDKEGEEVAAARIGELERKLAYRGHMENLALEISKRFMDLEQSALEPAIDRTLEDCARFAAVESAHVIRVSDDGATFSLTNMWRDAAAPLPTGTVKDVPVANMAPDLRAGLMLRVDDVDALPDELPMKRSLHEHGIRALVAVPLKVGDRLLGSAGLARHTQPHTWTDEELLLVRFFADTVAHALARMRADAERADLEARLQSAERLDAIGRFAGGIAHDFNNLLLVILGAADLAARETADPARLKTHLEAVRSAGTRAAELTRGLLTFSRRQPTHRRSVDLNLLLSSLHPLLRRLLPETIDLDLIAGHKLSAVLADSGQIEQVVVNLAANARDAMAAGGRLTIETQNVRINGEYTKAHPWARPGRYVLLTVADTGVGIPKENLDRVFEPFFTTKEAGGGTGLGLASVYGIVKRHEGLVHVYSEVDHGTSFKVYLPASETPAEAVGTPIDRRVEGGSETLLVGEDDAHVRRLLEGLLVRAGYTVVTAADGAEVVQRFNEDPKRFDLVIVDVVMPALPGVEAARRMRQVRPDLPLLLTSGYSAGALPDGAELPGVPLLSKPFEPDALLRAIRRALDDGSRERRSGL